MARVGSSVAAPVTRLLVAWGQGDKQALEQLTPLVYRELRRLAQWHMNGERPGHTLQATALVNEAYLRLIDINQIKWQDRGRVVEMKFFGGLSGEEIAEVLQVSPDTVKRDWKLAKAWLGRELRKTRGGPGIGE